MAVALVGLVALSFFQRWTVLTQTPFPVGVDGYFYPVQLRSLLETGSLAYPASPLTFWLMAPLAALTDPVTGAKLGAALFGALIALPAYGVGARLGRSRGAGLVAAALATTSAGSAFLTIEFVKNGVGLTMLLTALWLLLRALESPTAVRIALAVGGAVLALLAHKMAAGMLVLFAVPAVLAAAAGRGVLRGRRLLMTIGLVVGVAGLLLVLGLLFPRRLPSPGDIDLARALFAGQTRWGAPALVTGNVMLTFGHEALIGALVGIVGAFVLSLPGQRALDQLSRRLPAARVVEPTSPATSRKRAAETALAWMVVLLAIGIAWPRLEVSDVQGLGFRLRVAAFVPMALAAAIVVGRLLARVPHKDLVLAGLALVLAARTPGRRDEGRIVAHPAMVAAVQALQNRVPPADTVIVPERHIVYMVAWYTRAHVRLRPEGVPREHRWRLMPLAWIGMGSVLDDALMRARTEPGVRPPLGLHPRHPNGLVLVSEPTWQWLLDAIPADARAHWARWPTI